MPGSLASTRSRRAAASEGGAGAVGLSRVTGGAATLGAVAGLTDPVLRTIDPGTGMGEVTRLLERARDGDAAAAVSVINRLQPEALCFVLPESAKDLVESAVQPHIEHMPRRWDWVTLADTFDVTDVTEAADARGASEARPKSPA